ncbi:MAG: HD domain-containing phosphohydrolase [Vulcanimicrobiaceae bacterium]
MNSASDGAVGLYSAVGDALAGRSLGFGRRRAALAARFALHRGVGEELVAAAWVAGALADIGLLGVVPPPGADQHVRLLFQADAPLHGARLVAGMAGLPARAADTLRWHSEHDDGTGIPDRLRWDGIPTEAAALGIAHAFLAAMEDPDGPRAAPEALFTVIGESGRLYRVELVRAFREFVGAAADWDQPFDPDVRPTDEAALVADLALRLDARDHRTIGRTARLAHVAAMLSERLPVDGEQAARLAQLVALGRATPESDPDDFDPLSRFARERRSSEANRAAAIAASVAGFAADAPHLAASGAWYEDGGVEPLGGILGLALAVESLPAIDAPRRVAAASGSQFHPEVAREYLAVIGVPT